jgi:Poly-adenylate binding protein, unique domain
LLKSESYLGQDEDGKREAIGEIIYDYIEKSSDESSAQKITGMIIDLPFEALELCIKTYTGL